MATKLQEEILTFMGLRLLPKTGDQRLEKNASLQLAFLQAWEKLGKAFSKESTFITGFNSGNTMIFIFKGAEGSHLWQLYEQGFLLIKELDLKPLVAFYTGAEPLVKTSSGYLWLGGGSTKCLQLAVLAGTKDYPDVLLSHSFYQHLEPGLQSQFTHCYYFNHICCYG